MKQVTRSVSIRLQVVGFMVVVAIVLGLLLLFKLGSLTHGLSAIEIKTATTPVGWHGIYNSPLYLPIKILRSIVFYLFPRHGQMLTRLPNALLGAVTILSFGWLCWLWHGRRSALLVSVLFACNAWVLHVSRFASNDVMYLWAGTSLLLVYALLHRLLSRWYVWYGALLVLGLLMSVPGMIWFVLALIWLCRVQLKEGWRLYSAFWQRLVGLFVLLGCLLLLVPNAFRPGQLLMWLGIPSHFESILLTLKQIVAVGVHLLIRGPEYPWLWLGKAPILDAFMLVMALLGIYFYARHWKSPRSQLLIILFVIGAILIGLGGPVSLSLLVPAMFALAAMGLTYMLHKWLRMFPSNPIARRIGVGLIGIAVLASCIYNLRAYFVAWAYAPITQIIFHYHR